MLFSDEIARKGKCSRREQLKCIPLILDILELALRAGRDGILALDDVHENIVYPFLQKGIRYVTDGTPADITSEILHNHILFSDSKGADARKLCLIAEGVMAIHEGLDLYWVKEKLTALVPDITSELETSFLEFEKRELAQFTWSLGTRATRDEETTFLESWLPQADDRTVQLLLRDAPPALVAMALAGASGKSIQRIFDTMADRGRIMLKKDIESFSFSSTSEIAAAQEELTEIYKKILS